MGKKVTTLAEIVLHLDEYNQELTIYAAEPWNEDSAAIVDCETDEGDVSPKAVKLGLSYFLEVDIANEFLSEWAEAQSIQPDRTEFCRRLIDYAVNDA